MAVPAVTAQAFEEISTAIVQERKRRGWSQSELARRAGLNLSTVFYMEHPHRRDQAPTLTSLLLALGVLGLELRLVYVGEQAAS